MNVILKLESNVVTTIFSVLVLIVGACVTYLSGALLAAFGRYRVWVEGQTSLENHFREASLIGALCGAFKSRSYIRTRVYLFLLAVSLTALVTESLIFIGIQSRECDSIGRIKEKSINAICSGNDDATQFSLDTQVGQAIELYERYLRSGGTRAIRVSHLSQRESDKLVLGSGTNDPTELNIDQMLTTKAEINLTIATDSSGDVKTINPGVDVEDERVLSLSNGIFETFYGSTRRSGTLPKGISVHSRNSLVNERFDTIAVVSFTLDRNYTLGTSEVQVVNGTAEVTVIRTKGKGSSRLPESVLASTMVKNVTLQNIDNKHVVDDMIAIYDIIKILSQPASCERKVKVYKTCTEITSITFAMIITQGFVLLTLWGFYIYFWLKTRKSLDWNSSNERFMSFLENAGKDVIVIDKGRLQSFVSIHGESGGICRVRLGTKKLEATPYITMDRIKGVEFK